MISLQHIRFVYELLSFDLFSTISHFAKSVLHVPRDHRVKMKTILIANFDFDRKFELNCEVWTSCYVVCRVDSFSNSSYRSYRRKKKSDGFFLPARRCLLCTVNSACMYFFLSLSELWFWRRFCYTMAVCHISPNPPEKKKSVEYPTNSFDLSFDG